jgi:Domain of unknown function (DUF4783)
MTEKPSEAAIAETLKSAFIKGNSKDLAIHFDKTLELVIDTERVSFRNVHTNQAELIVKSFFKKYPPKDFRYIFQGTASKVRYCTATYHSGGAAFQVYILMHIDDAGYKINTLHLKKE